MSVTLHDQKQPGNEESHHREVQKACIHRLAKAEEKQYYYYDKNIKLIEKETDCRLITARSYKPLIIVISP